MPSLTLREASKEAYDNNETLRASVIRQFAEQSDIMDAMTWMTISGNAYRYNQEATLPGIAFRGVNESFTPSTGVINPQVEPLFTIGGELDVDNFILRTEGPGARARQENLKLKAVAADITRAILAGDNTAEPREFDGWKRRVIGDQLVANGSTDGGDVLSLLKLDEAIDLVNSPTHLVMNREMKRRFIAAMRSTTTGVAGNVTMDRDDLGRRVTRYNDLPILVGYAPSRNTAILPFTELGSTGSTATASSIYVVSFREDGVTGLQSGPMMVKDLGELQDSPKRRTRVEWDPGMAILDGFAIARLYGVKSGAIAA
jgi:hypothetical protein